MNTAAQHRRTAAPSVLAAALADLVEDVDRDHREVTAALAGGTFVLPVDPGLAGLCRQVAVQRLVDPGASSLDLLAHAADAHPEAAAEHLTWVRARAAGRVLQLPDQGVAGPAS